MYSAQIDQDFLKVKRLLETASSQDPRSLIRGIGQSSSNLHKAVELLGASHTDEVYDIVTNHAVGRKRDLFGNKVFAISPLYVSSICREQCVYCNYRAGNKTHVPRNRLTLAELDSEITALIDQGIRTIELVYATDPFISAEIIAEHIERTSFRLQQVGGGHVGLNADALNRHEYSLLKDAGLDFAVLWMETYDRKSYQRLHPGKGPKTNFEKRLDAYDEMIAAGLPMIGLGVLSGLSDWRTDWAMLFAHQMYLKNTYGIEDIIVGCPRLKPAVGAKMQSSPHTPSDKELQWCLTLQSLINVKSLPFLNTREDFQFCLDAANGGGALFTFNCQTIPGGYSLGQTGYQFPSYSFEADSFRSRTDCIEPVFHWRDYEPLARLLGEQESEANSFRILDFLELSES